MPNGQPENVQSVLPCGKKAWVKGVIPKPRPTPPPRPPETYEIKIQVVEKNKEKKKVGSIRIHDLNDTDKRPDAVTTPDGLATFSNLKTKEDRAFTLSNFNEEKYKVEEYYGPFTPEKTGKEEINEIAIYPIIRIYLKLSFKDPDGDKRNFPKGVKLTLQFEEPYDGGKKKELKVETNKDGIISDGDKPYIEVYRNAKNFKIDFSQHDAKSIICEKNVRNSNDPKPDKKAVFLETDKLGKDLSSYRAFKLPWNKWTMENSDWDTSGIAAYNKDQHQFDVYTSNIGQKNQAAEMVLNMHWQHVRFIYYDRYVKGSKMLSVLPVLLEGYQDKKSLGSKPEPQSDTASNWVCGKDIDENVQCIPWIIQEAGKPKPDKNILLKFETPQDTFIKTSDKDKSTSRICVSGVDKAIIDTPNAERLRYYDLPKIWNSKKYYCCEGPDDENAKLGKRFEDLADKACTLSKPLTFCLDDIVLTDNKLKPLPDDKDSGWIPDNRVAIFSHLFNKKQFDNSDYFDGTAAGTKPDFKASQDLNDEGVYKPDEDGKMSFFTKKPEGTEKDRNYISDYPKWTRLVIANGNMFDVFDKRIEDEKSDVVGARAAVLWNKSTDTTNRVPGNQISPRPNLDKDASHPFFAIQPFYEQHYKRMYWDSNELGRFDMTLLRCCDYFDDQEVAVNMQFFRYFFDFVRPPLPAPPPAPATALDPAVADKDDFNNKIIKNVNARWNGYDSINSKRAQLNPQEAEHKLIVPIIWYAQSLKDKDQCHFHVKVSRVKGGRDNRGGDGTGDTQVKNFQAGTNGGNDWFTSAHECGHANAQPDEYNERWDGASYGQISLLSNTPGDPFEPDGRKMENPGQKNNTIAGAAMMNGNSAPRNRYFWTAAEWARLVTGFPFNVNYDVYLDYWVPPHSDPKRTYVYNPIANFAYKMPYTPRINLNGAEILGNRANVDFLLYALGKDKFSDQVLPGINPGPYDGILVVTVKIKCILDISNLKNDRTNILVGVTQALSEFNNKYYLTGKLEGTNPYNWSWSFKRCLIHFSPQFFVPDSPYTAAPGVDAATDAFNPTMISTLAPDPYILEIPARSTPATSAEWVASTPKPTEIMTEPEWRPNDTTLTGKIIGAYIRGYHNLTKKPADLVGRINKLSDIINKCKDGNAEHDKIKAQAVAMKTYLKNCGPSKKLTIQIGTSEASYTNAVKDNFKQFFPGMIGIYKLPGDITAADMKGWVAKLKIKDDDVPADVHSI